MNQNVVPRPEDGTAAEGGRGVEEEEATPTDLRPRTSPPMNKKYSRYAKPLCNSTYAVHSNPPLSSIVTRQHAQYIKNPILP